MPKRILPSTLLVALSSLTLAQKPVDLANPFVGTDGHGHAYPGATAPFGMVQLSPDTRLDTWDGCSGYHYSDKTILGFSHTHLSGTGIGGLGDIMVMPYVGPVGSDTKVASRFSHDQEWAKPGYYKVFLQDPKVTAELTATPRAGFHRYTFPASDQSWILVDLNHGIQSDTKGGMLKKESATRLVGYRNAEGWGGNRVVYFVLEFSKPFETLNATATATEGSGESVEFTGKPRVFAKFKTKAGEAISVRVGISPTSIEAARANLKKEIATWNFDQVKKAAQDEWNTTLSIATIETKDAKVKRTFYSNMYLSFQAPNLFSDADGSFLGQDGKVHPQAGFQNHSTFSLWDTYRAMNPLATFLQPQRTGDMVNSLLAGYDQGRAKTTGVWILWNQETWVMIGNHSVSMISEAILKDQKGFDYERAYQAMKTTQMADRSGLDTYKRLGYVASTPGGQATSKTIEYGYNDFCLARVAEKLGHKEDADYFYKRAANYRNHWDGTTRFFRGRKASGAWRAPFDPIGLVGDEYTESDAWQYLFAVQHDVPGMIELQGGKEAFANRLDEMFTMDSTIHTNIPDITGLIGQYAHGNEPCHHVAYLYDYAGQPWKTQARVREVMDRFYSDTPDGEIGNVDCGQTSAWYVFSALGFYPVNPASNQYAIGSPLVDKATFHLAGGKQFTVIAKDNSPKNVYIQSAKLNGRDYTSTALNHGDIMAGGTLEFVMGPKPNPGWTVNPPMDTMPKSAYGPLPEPASTKPVVLALPIRVSAGEDESVEGFTVDPNMMEGSVNGTRTKIDVSAPGAGPESLYMAERYGSDFTYRFAVPTDRTYTVKLHFAEIFNDEIGSRVEDVFLNGNAVLTNFDILKEAGRNKALVKTYTNVKPNADGTITIRVKAVATSPDQNAKISGIEILP